jgi:EAL domain-containing protein (putative c-di-GMP-specific phosphodiesterase class I)
MFDQDGTELLPSWFLPAITDARLSKEFDRAVLQKTLYYLARDHALLEKTQKCSINITGYTLCDPSFAAFMVELLALTGVSPEILVLEITETDMIAEFATAQSQLQTLRKMGLGCAVDDFGVGLATFDYLKRLRPNWIKIDGSFIRSLGQPDADPLDLEIIFFGGSFRKGARCKNHCRVC